MSDDAPDTLVLGVGNPLRGDDGIGPAVIGWLHNHGLPPGVAAVDGGTGGLELVLTLANRRKAIVVDAVDVGRAPGTWVRFEPDLTQSAGDGSMMSLHIAGLTEALALGAALGVLPKELVIYGVQPARLDQPFALSAEVQSAVPAVGRALLSEIADHDGESAGRSRRSTRDLSPTCHRFATDAVTATRYAGSQMEMEQLIQEAKMTGIDTQLVRKLRSPHNEVVLEAVGELRQGGWLNTDSLRGMSFRCANLQGADLREANLRDVDLRMADLNRADLSGADLQGARLNKANLHETNLKRANLQGVDLFNTDLERVRNLSDEQLAQASRLRVATMLDGSRYDGRFNLPGDLRDAHVLHVDLDDPAAMADFYRVSVEAYQRGQEWAQKHLPRIRREAEQAAASPEAQLIAQLRHDDSAIALKAVEQLREGGWLSKGTLKGANLQRTHLKGANLNLASMEGADLREANLQGADLGVANLQGADLSKANLQGAKLLWAGLQGARLVEADLREVDLTGANLRKAHLRKANLKGANLSAANLHNADLSEANLEGARNLRQEELAKVFKLWGAILPDGSRYDGHFNLPGDKEFAHDAAA